MKHLAVTGLILSFVMISCDTNSVLPEEEPEFKEQTAQIYGQGFEGDIINGAEANIFRTQNNGFFVDLAMPAPAPGSYQYPEGAEEGNPEVFTLWVFVFNDPEAEEFDAAYLGSAHVAEDISQAIKLNGHITSDTEPFTGEGQLTDPMEAKVRLTVAPHGELDADKLPGQLTTPSGGPDYWWITEFNPQDSL
ncbi:hypothetical protein BH23BAC3_BH23BAC3_24110 [soil metagenome]